MSFSLTYANIKMEDNVPVHAPNQQGGIPAAQPVPNQPIVNYVPHNIPLNGQQQLMPMPAQGVNPPAPAVNAGNGNGGMPRDGITRAVGRRPRFATPTAVDYT